jgi:hypothetical protein
VQELYELFGNWNIATYPKEYRKAIEVHKWACFIENRIKNKKTSLKGVSFIERESAPLISTVQNLPWPSIIVSSNDLKPKVVSHNKIVRLQFEFKSGDKIKVLKIDSVQLLDENHTDSIDWLRGKLNRLGHITFDKRIPRQSQLVDLSSSMNSMLNSIGLVDGNI